MNPYKPSKEPADVPSPPIGRVSVTSAAIIAAVAVSFAVGYVAGEMIGAESYRRYAREVEEKNALNTKSLLDEIHRLKQK